MIKRLITIGVCVVAGYATLKYLRHQEPVVMHRKVEMAIAYCRKCGTEDLAVFNYGEVIQCHTCGNQEVVYK